MRKRNYRKGDVFELGYFGQVDGADDGEDDPPHGGFDDEEGDEDDDEDLGSELDEDEDEDEDDDEEGDFDENDEQNVPLVVLNFGGKNIPIFKPFSWLKENSMKFEGAYDPNADVTFGESPDLFFADLLILSDAIREMFCIRNDYTLEFPDLGLKFCMHSSYMNHFTLNSMHQYHTAVGNPGPLKMVVTEESSYSFERTLRNLQDAVISCGGVVENPIVLEDDDNEDEDEDEDEIDPSDDDAEEEDYEEIAPVPSKRKTSAINGSEAKRVRS
eukprot:Sdes_comp20836_c0_seq1m17464